MEQVGVVETPPSAWQALVLTAILYLHMYQGTKKSFALPIELTCKLMAAHIGIEPMT